MPTRHDPRRFLATLLFTDIVGSTDLAARVGDREWRRLLELHNRAVRSELRHYQGREMDTAGDGFFAVFDTPENAVRCAVAISAALAPLGLQVRAGVHTGECELIGGKAGGMAVNIAARIAAQAGPAEVLVSSSTRDMTVGSGLRFTGGEERTLKGVADPWRVFALIPEGVAGQPSVQRAPTRLLTVQDRRRPLLVAVGGLLVLAVAVPVVVFRARSAPAAGLGANVVGVLGASGSKVSDSVAVGERPTGVASDNDAVWITNSTSNTVSRVDRRTRTVTPIPVGVGPTGIATGAGAVWVANGGDATVSKIEPASNTVTSIPVGAGASGVIVANGRVWVTNTLDASVTRIDPVTARVVSVTAVGAGPTGIASGAGSVWVTNEGDGTVSRLDPATGKVRGGAIRVGNGPTGLAAVPGAVWVANNLDGSLSRIDALDSSVTTAPIAAGGGPFGVAVRGRAVWVSNEYAGTLTRFDADTRRITRTIDTHGAPLGLAFVGDELWFTNAGGGTLHRGGVLTLASAGLDAFGAEDPAFDPFNSYDVSIWRVLALTNDGLVGLRRVAGAQGALPVPDLATSLPAPTDGGLTYAFTLRPGLRYSTGAPVTARDIRRGLERSLREAGAPGFLFDAIRGADKCSPSTPTCDLSAGVVTDDAAGTVTFHLTKQDPNLIYKLSLPSANALPADVPLRVPTGFVFPATGPYMIKTYVPLRRSAAGAVTRRGKLLLVRNPHFTQWSAVAQPDGYVDAIQFTSGLSAREAAAEVTEGRADALWPSIDAGAVADLRAQHPSEVHSSVQPNTNYLFFNTRVAPFNNRDARRAVAYAVDRSALSSDPNAVGLGQVTCQLLPPDFPGYRPYCPFTLGSDTTHWRAPDLQKALALVASSGTRGAPVTFVYGDNPTWRATALRFAAVLTELGYRPRLKAIPIDSYFPYLGLSRNDVQAGLSGWSADYPAASTFLDTLLSCAAYRPTNPDANTNYGGFCDPVIDRQIKAALRQQADDPSNAVAAWAEVDRAITDASPVIPYSNASESNLVGHRVGNYQSHVMFGMLLAQMWVQ